jgi:hypothetical protein
MQHWGEVIIKDVPDFGLQKISIASPVCDSTA